jgi:serine/threonine protein phosphatase PrpC
VKVRFAGTTDVGREREQNEDAFLVIEDYSVCVAADGLGGHRSGSIASSLAVATLSDFFFVTVRPDATWPFPYDRALTEEENYLVTGFRLANRRIFDRSLKTLTDFGMGTTCVAAMFNTSGAADAGGDRGVSDDVAPARSALPGAPSTRAGHVAVANVGDSRCYRLRRGALTQLTRDHSIVSDAVHAAPWMTPEEIAQLPPNVITRALGIREDVLVDVAKHPIELGDLYLLCSDGLSGQVDDAELTTLLAGVTSATDLQALAQKLVDEANARGGIDNVTVVFALVVD